MSAHQGPPPYPEAPLPNTQGPPQYSGGQPHIGPPQYSGGQPHMGPHYSGGAPVIIMHQHQQQQQQQQQRIIVRSSGTSHGLCLLICLLTGGLSLPCWIWACMCN